MSISELPKNISFKFTEAFSNQWNDICPGKWRKKSSEMMEPAEIEVLYCVEGK